MQFHLTGGCIGFCASHGGVPKCEEDGCENIQAWKEGGIRNRCRHHGGIPICTVTGCMAPQHYASGGQIGFCYKHGGQPNCLHKGCETMTVKDSFCTIHHPDYIASVKGYSKESCDFMDELERELGVSIQHVHYNKFSGDVTGSEHHCNPDKKQYRSDGFIRAHKLDSNPKLAVLVEHSNQGAAFEYQGSFYHGHPSMWKDLPEEEQKDHRLHGKWLKDLAKWKACEEAGATVYYILDTDFKEWKKHSVGTSLFSKCRRASAHF